MVTNTQTLKEVIPKKYQNVYNFVGWAMIALLILLIVGVIFSRALAIAALFLILCLAIFIYKFNYNVVSNGMEK